MKETMVVTFLLTTKKHLILLNMIFFHQNLNILQWCNLTLTQWFWVTKVCLWMGKISKICLLVAQLGQQLLEKQILKIILDKLWWNDYFKLEFTPFKAEQPLKGMVFQEKEAQIYQYFITQHEQYFFSFQTQVSAVCLFHSKSCHIMLESHVSSSG